MYDYLVVGAGLYGAVFARQMTDAGKKVLVIDKRPNIAGNVYTEDVEGIHVHKYGAHIFHTNNQTVWEYVNRFATFNHFVNSPIAKYKGEVYSLPFNMYTFNKMWGVATPEEAQAKIEAQRLEAGIKEPKNLEEQAISLVGTDIYQKLIKGYTEKQWGRDCKELPSFIIKRLPVRLTYDNNYFNALYQGIPMGGYTKMVAKMLEGIEVKLNEDYLTDKAKWDGMAEKVVYTGAIDAYFAYSLGALEYRSVRFDTEVLDMPNFQGNAAVNYTDKDMPWTRIIEHKWFEFGKDDDGNDIPKTVISREYSSEWELGDEPYYPVNDEKNSARYAEYKKLAEKEGIELKEGTYYGGTGPTYETPHEYKFIRIIGGDATGMSTIPEVITARHSSIPVFGVSVITNEAHDDYAEDFVNDGDDVVKTADAAASKMCTLFIRMLENID